MTRGFGYGTIRLLEMITKFMHSRMSMTRGRTNTEGKNLVLLAVVLLAALVTTSCDGSKYSQLPQERCRSSLPITVPSEEIAGCQSLSREVRGGVMVAV